METSENTFIQRFTSFVKSNPKITVPALIILGLLALYGSVQIIILQRNGPQAKVSEYINAVVKGDFKSLDDKTLFPGPKVAAPLELQLARDPISRESIVLGPISRAHKSATAEIQIGDYTVINLELTETYKNVLGFSVPVWSVSSPTPSMSIGPNSNMSPSQVISIGNEKFKNQDLPTPYYAVLPSTFRLTSEAKGFMGQFSQNVAVFSDLTVINPISGILVMDEKLKDKTTAELTAQAKACLKSGCKQLGKWAQSDFDLWDQVYEAGHPFTSSKFTKRFTYNRCSNSPSFVLESYDKVTAELTCFGIVNAGLYVRNTYFSGYFGDYYDDWSYFDSQETSLTVKKTLKFKK